MLVCVLCGFDTTLDDAAIVSPCGRCICLRCFAHVTGNAIRMPARLRRQLEAVMQE